MVAFFVKNNKRRWLVGSGSAGLADGGLLHRDGRGSGEWAIDGKVGLVGGRGGAVSAERNLPWMFVWFGIILTQKISGSGGTQRHTRGTCGHPHSTPGPYILLPY